MWNMKKYIIFSAVLISFGFVPVDGQQDFHTIFDYCNTTLNLAPSSSNTSISLFLSANNQPENCEIKVFTSETHLLYFRIVDNNTELKNVQQIMNDELFGKEIATNSSDNLTKRDIQLSHCPLEIYQVELLYSMDPCAETIMPDGGGLVSNEVHLKYTPNNNNNKRTRWLLITIIGVGEICLDKSQHTCLQAGWTPLLCISKSLLCNGVVNCPTGGLSTDENPQICKDKKMLLTARWEKLATQFLKKLTGKSKPGALLPAIQKGDKKWLESSDITSTENPKDDNLSTNISQYGPWGYLMMGMLLCGTILTLCGLWECCCEKSKRPTLGTGSTVPSPTVSSTAVLVLSSGSTATTHIGAPPPNYEDLDQPPSYQILFPEKIQ